MGWDAPLRSPAVRRLDGVGRALAVLAAAGVVAGFVVRIALIRAPEWGLLESDEAVVGLMARHILDGELPTFYWGQSFGGAAEAFLVAAVFAVGGPSTLGIRLVPFGLAVVAALLVWRVGRRLLGPAQGVAAGLLFWLWPSGLVWWGIKERLFYWSTIVAGLAFVLACLRLAERPNRRDALLAGLAAGIGWWSTPQIVVFVVPTVAWIVVQRRHALRPLLGYGLPAAVVGAAPWLAYNLAHRFVSLNPPEVQANGQGTYVDHLETFAARGLPMALGVRLPLTEQWVPGGKALFFVMLAALGFVVVRRRSLLLALGLVVFPLVHALSPLSHYVGEGRYLTYYAAFLALAFAAAVRHRLALAAVVVALVGLSAFGLAELDRTGHAPYAVAHRLPDYGALVDDLERHRLTKVYAEYWVAYRLAFDSRERVVVATLPQKVSRRLDDDRHVYRADRTAYVFEVGSPRVDALRGELQRAALAWQEHEVGGFRVIVPAGRFTSPEQVVPTAG